MKKSPTRRQTKANMDSTSARSKTSSRKTKAGSRGRKKPQKKDNTKLFIGIGVGVFIFLIIVISVASGGKKAPRKVASSTNKKSDNYLLPIAVRKQIFSEFMKASIVISNEVNANVDKLSDEERRKQGPLTQRKIKAKEKNFQYEQTKKYRQKYPKAKGKFVSRCVDEGIDNNWKWK
jgi:hypothetical protein